VLPPFSLEAHFGSNFRIINFAKAIIHLGRRDAVRALNNYVDVLGSELNPNLIIKKVANDFEIDFYRALQPKDQSLEKLKNDVKIFGYLNQAKLLIQASQLIVEEYGGGLFSPPSYNVYLKDEFESNKVDYILKHSSTNNLIAWVQTNLC
jgi:hypothetical protein